MNVIERLSGIMEAAKNVFKREGRSRVSGGFGGFGGGIPPLQFNSISSFLDYYKKDAFSMAYSQMDPLTCYSLAYSNPWITAVVNAITRPIASSTPYAASTTQDGTVNPAEEEYLVNLITQPNETTDGGEFLTTIMKDLLITGNAYIEVAYNGYGVPGNLYPHPPYMIKIEEGRYIHKTGYQFKDGELIHIKLPNPFDPTIGLSPLVPLVASLMLDRNILLNNLKYFTNSQLKGILSIDKSVDYLAAEKEVKRIQDTIQDMQTRGEEGHLVAFGVTFQSLASTNRDMMTPDVEKSIRDRILAVYGVPPSKICLIEAGNIGAGSGEAQSETMNETLQYWASSGVIKPINQTVVRWAGLETVELGLRGITHKNELMMARVHREWIRSSIASINEVRDEEGLPPLDSPVADMPLVPLNVAPISLFEEGHPKYGEPDEDNKPGPDDQETDRTSQAYEEILHYMRKDGLIR